MSVRHALRNLEFRKLPFKLSVPGGNSTREYVRQLDVLSEIYVYQQGYRHGSAAKIWKQGNVEIRVLCVALWKYRQADGNVNLHLEHGIAKVIKNPLKKPRPRSLPYSPSLSHFSHQMSSRSHPVIMKPLDAMKRPGSVASHDTCECHSPLDSFLSRLLESSLLCFIHSRRSPSMLLLDKEKCRVGIRGD